jgi:hypothetical protein
MDNGLLLARSSPATERIEPGGITALLPSASSAWSSPRTTWSSP